MNSILDLTKPSIRVRFDSAPGFSGAVDEKKGVIRGYSVITRGPARGHGVWIDGEMLDQVATFGNAAERGKKSRFTHPSLSGDGLGTFLGRTINFRRKGDQVLADMVLSQTAKDTPNGDLWSYTLRLAKDEPDMFAASIVFEYDEGAMQRHAAEHTDKDGDFNSPDEANEKNFPHARVAELFASDLVDEAAANPGGLFSASFDLAANGEAAADYLLGLTDKAPELFATAVAPERMREFFTRHLARRGLSISRAVPVEFSEESRARRVKVLQSLETNKARHAAALLKDKKGAV